MSENLFVPNAVAKMKKNSAPDPPQEPRNFIDPLLFKDYKIQTDVDRKLLLGVWEDLQNKRTEEDKDS